MARFAPDAVLDLPLDEIATGTRLTVLSGAPADFSEIAALVLAERVLDSGDFTKADGSISGRKVTIAEQTGVPITASGTATHAAVDDGTTLLLLTEVVNQALTSGDTMTTSEFTLTVPDPVDPDDLVEEPLPSLSYYSLDQTSATRDVYFGARTAPILPWTNVGGDWRDLNGDAQGTVPFAQDGGAGEIQIDISNMLSGWTGLTLRRSSDYIEIFSLTGDSPPYLIVDGVQIDPYAMVRVNTSTDKNLNDGLPKMKADSNQNILLDFDVPSGAVNATLVVYQTSGTGDIQVYRTNVPELNPSESQTKVYGIGQGLTIEELKITPSVVAAWDWAEGWESEYNFVATGTGGATGETRLIEGETWKKVRFEAAAECGVSGPSTAFNVRLQFDPTPASIVPEDTDGLSHVFLQYEFESAFDVPLSDAALAGGKFPGFDMRYGNISSTGWQAKTGNGGTPAPGVYYPDGAVIRGADYTGIPIMAGGSSRGQWAARAGAEHDARDAITLGSYRYHPQWTTTGTGEVKWWHAGVLPGVRHTIEQELKINSITAPFDADGNGVGQPDGIIRVWIDGKLAHEETNMIWTHHPYMNINAAWIIFYHGGQFDPCSDQDFWVGPVTIATQYIGPREVGVSPPGETMATMVPGQLLHLADYECESRVPGMGCVTTWESFGGWRYDHANYQMLQFSGAHSVTNRTDVDAFDLNTLTWASLYPSMTCTQVANGESDLNAEEKGYWESTGHCTPRHSYDQNPVVPINGVPHLMMFVSRSNISANYCKPYESNGYAIARLPLSGAPVWQFGKSWKDDPNRGWDFSRPVEYDPVSGYVVTTKSYAWSWYDAENDSIVAQINGSIDITTDGQLIYFPPNDRFYYFAGSRTPRVVIEITPNRSDLNQSTWVKVFPTGPQPLNLGRYSAYDTVNQKIGAYSDGYWHTFDPLTMTWIQQEMPFHLGAVADYACQFNITDGVFMLHTSKLGTNGRAAYAWKPDPDAPTLPEA